MCREIGDLKLAHKMRLGLNDDEISYFVYQKEMENNAYDSAKDEIKILFKDDSLKGT